MASNGLLAVNEALEEVQHAKAATVEVLQKARTEYVAWMSGYDGMAGTARSTHEHAENAVAESRAVLKSAKEDSFEDPHDEHGEDPITTWREVAETALTAAITARDAGKATVEWCEARTALYKKATENVDGYIEKLSAIANRLDAAGALCKKGAKEETYDRIERFRTKVVPAIAGAKEDVETVKEDFLRDEEALSHEGPVSAIMYEQFLPTLASIDSELDTAARKAEDARPEPDQHDGGGGGYVIGEYDQQW